MKSLFFISLFAIISTVPAFSQKKQNRFGIGGNINTVGNIAYKDMASPYDYLFLFDQADLHDKSYAAGATISYILKNGFYLRLKLGRTERRINKYHNGGEDVFEDPARAAPIYTTYGIENLKITQSDFSFAPGIFYRYELKKFKIFAGADVEYIKHSETQFIDNYTQVKSANRVVNYQTETTWTFPKGYSAGTGQYLGIDFFPCKHVSIGFELSAALLYTDFKKTGSYRKVILQGNIPAPINYSFNDSYRKAQYTPVRSGLNVSYWF